MTDQIIKAFTELGFIPRPHQINTVERILDALGRGKRHIFLDAPTGSGKSLLAMVVQRVLGNRAVIVTATNSLVEQYQRDFPHVPTVIGAAHYPCELRNNIFKTTEYAADRCYKKSRFFYARYGDQQPAECDENRCSFVKSRKDKRQPISITNYPYYIIDQLYTKWLPDSYGNTPNPAAYAVDMGIFDEAQLINEQFSQHYVIHYSKTRAREFLADIRKLCKEDDSKFEMAYERVFSIIDENVARGSIGLKNVDKFLGMLSKFYLKMMDIIDKKKIFENTESSYDNLGAMREKYRGLHCKIDDYHKYKYEVVVDVNKSQGSLSVQPVFVGKTSQVLLQQQNIFMSATLNFDFMVKTLELDFAECELITVDYTFNVDDKTIDMTRARHKVNYANMYDTEVLDDQRGDIEEILKLHKGQNGVVITTSFRLAEELAKIASPDHEIIIHRPDETARQVIRRFKHALVPTVLISPSLFEGVDLPGLQSQFQVLPKAPYLSLGSKRMFYISRKHRGVYLQMSIMRMIQAGGRSTRDVGDRSVTYMLDKNCGTLFRSRHNTWRKQFNLVS